MSTRHPSHGLRAVIFDFDGTLVDSEPVHAIATSAGLREVGIELSQEEFLARWVGLPDVECFRQVASDREVVISEAELARVRGVKNATYERAALEGRVPLCVGAEGLVRGLHREGRVKLAVCSAARRVEIEASLRRGLGEPEGSGGGEGIYGCFETIVSVEDVTRSKPDPEGYLLTLQRLGVEPSGAVAIEDTPRGIEAARGAGMRVVGVAQTVAASRLGSADLVMAHIGMLTPAVLASMFDAG